MTDLDKRMQQYVAGEMTADERIAFEDEVLSKPDLTDRLYADASVNAALEVAARARRDRAVAGSSAPWWRRPMLRWLAPAAAVGAVAVVLLVMQPRAPEPPRVFRGEDVSIEDFAPQGNIDQVPSEFVWTPIEGASFYRFELFDAASIGAFSTTTDQSHLTIDPAGTQVPATGYWVLTPLNDLRVPSGDARVVHYTTTK